MLLEVATKVKFYERLAEPVQAVVSRLKLWTIRRNDETRFQLVEMKFLWSVKDYISRNQITLSVRADHFSINCERYLKDTFCCITKFK